MTTTDELFPSKYLKHTDLKSDEVFTISFLSVEQVGMDKDEKPVLHFRGVEKGLVLNRTNAKTIEKLYGKNCDLWKNKRVVLYPTEVEFKGESVMSIRIRQSAPCPKPVLAQAAPDEEPEDPEDPEFSEPEEEPNF
jgi:hypothetical protein